MCEEIIKRYGAPYVTDGNSYLFTKDGSPQTVILEEDVILIESELTSLREEKERMREMLDEADGLLITAQSANYEGKTWYKRRDAFISSLKGETNNG